MEINNVASHLSAMAKNQPDSYALIIQNTAKNGMTPSAKLYQYAYTYQQLDDMSNLVAQGLKIYGIEAGMRTVLMVKPSLDFFVLVFALLKLEAVLVLIDPGMGIKNLGQCLAEAKPTAFIGNHLAHIARLLCGWSKQTINKTVLVGKRALFNHFITDLQQIKCLATGQSLNSDVTNKPGIAAILFTSGSTGSPKGVIYTHANFIAQITILKQLYGIEAGEIDLATFPLFGLFAPALGMTLVVPDMNFTRPAAACPKSIVDALIQYQCTTMFASPALLNTLGRWGTFNKIKLPTLRRVLSAGAPVAPAILAKMRALLVDDRQVFTPYGATEALPISSIGSDEVLQDTAKLTAVGAGICVGLPVVGLDVQIIELQDEPIAKWHDGLVLPQEKIGEICVQGLQVTESYFNRTAATELAKIYSDNGFYHRMGDLGYFDQQGRLWFCGRKSQRVITATETLLTICCEGIFNAHPAVFRSALVGAILANKTVAVICVELELASRYLHKQQLKQELLALGANHSITQNIKQVLFHFKFPVDTRHNAKIGREKLADWATAQLT